MAPGISPLSAFVIGLPTSRLSSTAKAFGVALHQFGELEQNALLVAIVELAPRARFERGARAFDGGIDVGRIALGNVIEDAAVPRRDVGEGLSRDACDRLAADDGFAGKLQGTCDRFKVRERCHDTRALCNVSVPLMIERRDDAFEINPFSLFQLEVDVLERRAEGFANDVRMPEAFERVEPDGRQLRRLAAITALPSAIGPGSILFVMPWRIPARIAASTR